MSRGKLDELLEALEFVSSAPEMGNEAYLSLETGAVSWHSEDGEGFDPPPSDIDDPGRYLAIPHKKDLGLGKPLVLAFAAETLPADFERIREMFSRRGAYGRFKDLLTHRNLLDRWHQFEADAQRRALRQWCEANGVEIEG